MSAPKHRRRPGSSQCRTCCRTPFPGDSHTKSKPDSLAVHIHRARMRREAQHRTSNAPATRAALTRRVTRTQTRRLPDDDVLPAGTAATGRQLLTLYVSPPEARELQSRAERARAHFWAARGSAGPRSGRRLPSRSPSASPPGQAPTPEGSTGPRRGTELRATCRPYGPSPPRRHQTEATPLRYVPPRRHWPDA